MTSKSIRGYRVKDGKQIEKIFGYGLDASAKIKKRKSKRVTVKRKSS